MFREHRSVTNTDDNLENNKEDNVYVDKDETRTKREADPQRPQINFPPERFPTLDVRLLQTVTKEVRSSATK